MCWKVNSAHLKRLANIDNDEWAIENHDAALELAGCIFTDFQNLKWKKYLTKHSKILTRNLRT